MGPWATELVGGTLPTAWQLELDELWVRFQSKLFYDFFFYLAAKTILSS